MSLRMILNVDPTHLTRGGICSSRVESASTKRPAKVAPKKVSVIRARSPAPAPAPTKSIALPVLKKPALTKLKSVCMRHPSPVSIILPAIPWNQLETIQKLSGGISDGAFLLRFKGHFPDLVLKCTKDAPEQAFASALAKAMGLQAPSVHLIEPGSKEVLEIESELSTQNQKSERQDLNELITNIEAVPTLVMERLTGRPLREVSFSLESGPKGAPLLRAAGAIAAFDLVLGNEDRFENFSPGDLLGGSEFPENFNNLLLNKHPRNQFNFALIDSTILGSEQSAGERTIFCTSEYSDTILTSPNAIIKSAISNPAMVTEYITNNVEQMLAQRIHLPPGADDVIQSAFIKSLKELAKKMTPQFIDKVHRSLGAPQIENALTRLKSQLQILNTLIRNNA